jgi:serralysin
MEGKTNMFNSKSLRCLSSLIIFILGLALLMESAPSKAGSAPYRAVPAFTPQEPDSAESCTEIEPSSLGATALSDRIWTGKKVLRVLFLDGSEGLRSKVQMYAPVWSEYANIKFVFIEKGQSDIRITFVNDGRSWSYIGNSAENVNTNKATMNFGWFDETTGEVEFQRVIWHEFGHALGLVHEHQSPKGDINWNKQYLYKYYEKPPFEWNHNVVRDNIIKKYAITQTQSTAYDPDSIMHYPIPANFTTDGYSVEMNTKLSSKDKELIKKLYP